MARRRIITPDRLPKGSPEATERANAKLAQDIAEREEQARALKAQQEADASLDYSLFNLEQIRSAFAVRADMLRGFGASMSEAADAFRRFNLAAQVRLPSSRFDNGLTPWRNIETSFHVSREDFLQPLSLRDRIYETMIARLRREMSDDLDRRLMRSFLEHPAVFDFSGFTARQAPAPTFFSIEIGSRPLRSPAAPLPPLLPDFSAFATYHADPLRDCLPTIPERTKTLFDGSVLPNDNVSISGLFDRYEEIEQARKRLVRDLRRKDDSKSTFGPETRRSKSNGARH